MPDLDLGANDRLTVGTSYLAGQPHGLSIPILTVIHACETFRLRAPAT
ncbi:hypothetical protein A8U91_03783 [Halomonas elongata]|uniref:Uncharacterized protein n=1 Tax=Halomonas elongata TaxID=2746 RepID=A0A1B8NXM6_HALEL|nr:hypothetical protein A8U91_03783 [Halomonas elongata]